MDQVPLQLSFLLEALPWVTPDQPDDLTSNVLWVKAEKRCKPGESLPLVHGRPHVPVDQVVLQERKGHQ